MASKAKAGADAEVRILVAIVIHIHIHMRSKAEAQASRGTLKERLLKKSAGRAQATLYAYHFNRPEICHRAIGIRLVGLAPHLPSRRKLNRRGGDETSD
jgi:hypothetical protein